MSISTIAQGSPDWYKSSKLGVLSLPLYSSVWSAHSFHGSQLEKVEGSSTLGARQNFFRDQLSDTPQGYYHRNCYKKYTMPSSLARISKDLVTEKRLEDTTYAGESRSHAKSHEEETVTQETDVRQGRRRSSHVSLRTNEMLSVICRKPNKVLREHRCRKEPLTLCMHLDLPRCFTECCQA